MKNPAWAGPWPRGPGPGPWGPEPWAGFFMKFPGFFQNMFKDIFSKNLKKMNRASRGRGTGPIVENLMACLLWTQSTLVKARNITNGPSILRPWFLAFEKTISRKLHQF